MEIVTHATLFSWSTWLAAQIGGTCAQRRRKWRRATLRPYRSYKKVLDEVFVLSRINKVEVRVISRSRRLRLITLTETLIILNITKPNLIIVLLYTTCFCFFTATQRARTWHDWPWPCVFLTWLLYNLQLCRHERWFQKFSVRFWAIRKEPWFTAYTFDNKHSCYGQLTPVETRYSLTAIT